jgi:hypothetical protein
LPVRPQLNGSTLPVVTEHDMPYYLFGLILMTPALWMFLFAQLVLLLLAVALCFLRATTARTSKRLVLGNITALILSVVVSALTVLAGYLESFAADGPDIEKAAQLASGILTVMNGLVMAIPFVFALGALLGLQLSRRARQSRGALSPQS